MNIARMYLANLRRTNASPRVLDAAERARVQQLRTVLQETYDHEAPIREPQPDISGELAFREYARRNGERVCDGDHENLRGACPECRASV